MDCRVLGERQGELGWEGCEGGSVLVIQEGRKGREGWLERRELWM